jgi:hypothetical protein
MKLDSQNPVSHFFQFFFNLLRGSFQMFAYLNLLIVSKFAKDLTQLTINNGLTWGVIRSVPKMIPSCEGWSQIAHIHFQMKEEINILPCLKGTKRPNRTIDGGVQNEISTGRCQTCFLYGSDNFPYIKRAYLFHLERCPIQVAIFPSELVRIGIVLKIFFGI